MVSVATNGNIPFFPRPNAIVDGNARAEELRQKAIAAAEQAQAAAQKKAEADKAAAKAVANQDATQASAKSAAAINVSKANELSETGPDHDGDSDDSGLAAAQAASSKQPLSSLLSPNSLSALILAQAQQG